MQFIEIPHPTLSPSRLPLPLYPPYEFPSCEENSKFLESITGTGNTNTVDGWFFNFAKNLIESHLDLKSSYGRGREAM